MPTPENLPMIPASPPPLRVARLVLLLALVCSWLAVAAFGAAAGEKGKRVRVLIQTAKRDIEVELAAARAPATVPNFLPYVDGKFYDGGRFHRTVRADNQPGDKVKIAVVQAGIDPGRARDEFPPVKLERTRDTG